MWDKKTSHGWFQHFENGVIIDLNLEDWGITGFGRGGVLVSCDDHNKLSQTRCLLKHQKFILSQLWGPAVWNRSVGKATFPPKTLWENTSWLLPASDGSGWSLTHGSIILMSSLIFPWPFSLCLCILLFCLQGHLSLAAGPTLIQGDLVLKSLP